ncbi:helix-hairpin-helix domain-containing protein [Niallia sp.]|uniref:helix-hairpin-helix domain-containing protein n=1 Tax=Niallia sp. TaxID=2837523 RepID=UPI0028988A6C|nr:helix-hairpin-helix domain-containing protein [Niallia sp.]
MMDWLRKNKKFLIPVLGGMLLLLLFRFSPLLMQKNDQEDSFQQEDLFAAEEEMAEEDTIVEDNQATLMLVDVKGAVKNPGVYEASEGERVNDIINKAGGILQNGEKNAVNFAMKVTDEMIIYVPYIGEEEEAAIDEASNQASLSSSEGLININKASETELLELPGVGPSKAAAIIEYREQNGGFSAKEDIKNITGIGEKTYEKLEPLISIN